MKNRSLVAVLVVAGLLSGCGSPTDAQSGTEPATDSAGYTVTGALDKIPVPPSADSFEIRSADLARASELSGHPRPDDTDTEELVAWADVLAGSTRDGWGGSVQWPDVLAPSALTAHTEVADELGVSLWTTDSFVELSVPPLQFTSVTGEFDDAALTRAVGEDRDGTRSLGGDDFTVDLADRTVARPTGTSLHLAMLDENTVSLSRAEKPLQALRSGDLGTAAEDDGVRAVAEQLDAKAVYSAWLARHTFVGGSESLPDPFDTLGIGFADDDGRAVVVAVYHHLDEADAERNADALPTILGDAPLTLDEVGRDGRTVTAVFTLGEAAPASVWGMPLQRDVLFTHVG